MKRLLKLFAMLMSFGCSDQKKSEISEPLSFWEIIENTKSGKNQDDQVRILIITLQKLSAENILEFERELRKNLAKSYTNKLWGSAYIINGGCSDDCFDYFRGWLVLQGKSVFENALLDPDSLADYEEIDVDLFCEDVWYIGNKVYREKTGNEIPDTVYREFQNSDLGEDWDFDDEDEMKTRYPKLVNKFSF